LQNLNSRDSTRLRHVSGVERVVLSLALSVSILPLIGLVATLIAVPISPGTVLRPLAGLTLLLTAVAAYRRLRLPADQRYTIDPVGWVVVGRDWLIDTEDTTDRVVTVVLVIGLILATSGIVYAAAAPRPSETYTEFYILSEDSETGELVASNYPTEFGGGAAESIHIGIENVEGRTVSYTVIINLQRLQERDGGSVVVQETELDRFETTLAHNETYLEEHDIQPTMQGDSLRLSFRLYRGAPEDRSTGDAYRTLHIWIDSEV
jgi:uncharacterized membrane protein